MEPEVPVVRRPQMASVLALLADIAAICYLTMAALGVMTVSSWQDAAGVAAFAIYGASRLVAASGLRRMKRYGSILECASACIFVAYCIVQVVWFKTYEAIPFLLPGVGISIAEFIYLTRPSTRALFSGPGVPMPLERAITGWFAIAAIVAFISLYLGPTVLHSGSKQKRTMADMRTIATAWEARATDVNRYNAAAIALPTSGVTLENLVTYLSPTYVKIIPMKDGWGHRWQFGVDQPWGSKEAAQVYTIISFGKDGKSQRKWDGGATTNFDCDIIYSNGTFVQYPEGVQQQ